MRRLIPAALGLFAILALAACGSGTTGTSTAPSAAAPSAAASAGGGGGGAACVVATSGSDVAGTMSGLAFVPTALTAKVGQTVAITNNDTTAHTFTLDDGSCDTGNVAVGAVGAIQFTAAGSYPFHCKIHPSMTGTVTVS